MPLEQVIGTRSSTAKTEIKTNRFGVSEGGERESDGRGETAHTVRQRARRKRSRNARAVRRRILSQIQELLRQSAEVVGKRSMGGEGGDFVRQDACARRVLWHCGEWRARLKERRGDRPSANTSVTPPAQTPPPLPSTPPSAHAAPFPRGGHLFNAIERRRNILIFFLTKFSENLLGRANCVFFSHTICD